jgi:small-conductance mechanosensitive channel
MRSRTHRLLQGIGRALGGLQQTVVLLLLVSLWSGWASAVEGDAPAPEAPLAAEVPIVERAAVKLDGIQLFLVRGATSYPAAQRARAIGDKIRAIAADPSVGIDSLRVVEVENQTSILAGDRLVMRVIDADAEIEGVSRKLMAELYQARIATAIATYRSDRDPLVLLTHSLYAIGATLAAVLLFFVIRRLIRWLDALTIRRLSQHIEKLEQESVHLVRADQLWHGLRGALTALRVLLTLVVLYLYLNYVLELFPWTRQASRSLFDLVIDPLRVMGSALIRDIPDLIFLAVLFVVTRYLLKLVRLFFAGVEQGSIRVASIDSELAQPTHRIVRFLIIVFALVVAYPYIPGSESNAFKGISVLLGVVFSLGSTSLIGNIIAGYTMIYRRAFRIGDRIQVGEFNGDVIERKLLVTRLRSIKNEEIVIPNSLIMNSNIVNYSTLARERGLILHTIVGIGYETPWRQVERMLCMAAERTPGVLKTPQPFILQRALGDFCINYELNAYCDRPGDMESIQTDLHRNILDVFNEYGVQIMTPAYVTDTEQPKLVPRENWFEAPAEPPAPSAQTRANPASPA